jgi:hypothetical protein
MIPFTICLLESYVRVKWFQETYGEIDRSRYMSKAKRCTICVNFDQSQSDKYKWASVGRWSVRINNSSWWDETNNFSFISIYKQLIYYVNTGQAAPWPHNPEWFQSWCQHWCLVYILYIKHLHWNQIWNRPCFWSMFLLIKEWLIN